MILISCKEAFKWGRVYGQLLNIAPLKEYFKTGGEPAEICRSEVQSPY
jgi:hypothetical protein